MSESCIKDILINKFLFSSLFKSFLLPYLEEPEGCLWLGSTCFLRIALRTLPCLTPQLLALLLDLENQAELWFWNQPVLSKESIVNVRETGFIVYQETST